MAAPKRTPQKKGPNWTTKKDDLADRKRGIKENSKRDSKLDKKRGVK